MPCSFGLSCSAGSFYATSSRSKLHREMIWSDYPVARRGSDVIFHIRSDRVRRRQWRQETENDDRCENLYRRLRVVCRRSRLKCGPPSGAALRIPFRPSLCLSICPSVSSVLHYILQLGMGKNHYCSNSVLFECWELLDSVRFGSDLMPSGINFHQRSRRHRHWRYSKTSLNIIL